jgi:GNAT superfamily N-acetyltransferase
MTVEYPSSKAQRIRLACAFRPVPRVDLSIDCVLEGQMGKALVDDAEHPRAFQIQVGPFFYLAGDAASPGGREMLAHIAPYTLFMPSALGWIEAARALYGERLAVFDRYSFSSERLSREHLERLCAGSPFEQRVKPMDAAFVASVWGREHFVDLSDYDSADDFVRRGVGFYLADGEAVIGAAFASLVCSKGIEVSIFVQEGHRRQGVATVLASHLLLWSLENRMDPHWDAANPESCRLAIKLGYAPTGTYEAHYLRE